MKTNKKGFTLIELLVVIAIIGILAGIVLVSLGSVRSKARKSSLKSTISSATTVASLCLNEEGSGALNGYAVGGAICNSTEITETWPALSDAMTNDGYLYSYTAGENTIIGTNGDGTAVCCSIETGSCIDAANAAGCNSAALSL